MYPPTPPTIQVSVGPTLAHFRGGDVVAQFAGAGEKSRSLEDALMNIGDTMFDSKYDK